MAGVGAGVPRVRSTARRVLTCRLERSVDRRRQGGRGHHLGGGRDRGARRDRPDEDRTGRAGADGRGRRAGAAHDRRRHHRRGVRSRCAHAVQAYFNARTFLEQRAPLSGSEAHRRIQTARMRDRLSEWAAAARTGTVGVAQSEAMARVAANPRLDPDALARDAGMLLDDAINLPHVEFERNLRVWEALADPIGDGSASVSRDANVARPTRSAVTVDILLDHGTMHAHTAGVTPDPRRFRNVVSRTQSGRRLHPDDAINAALFGHIRRAVYDSSGTIIDLGRRSRLFRGPARDAVMLLLATRVWIGCDQPSRGATPTTHSAGRPTGPPSRGTANRCAPATSISRNTGSRCTETTVATGTSSTPTATNSPERRPDQASHSATRKTSRPSAVDVRPQHHDVSGQSPESEDRRRPRR